ncbi:unnamed protein product, partial [Laminaria digitata]
MRYEALQGGGFQASMDGDTFDVLLRRFGVKMECFASPFNCRYARYCSAFADTDKPFGSLGSFFDFRPTEGSFEANPPFVRDVILKMANHMDLLLKATSKALTFVVIIPNWEDAEGWARLRNSPFLTKHLKIDRKDHSYCEGKQHLRRNRYRLASFHTAVFFLQTAAARQASPVTEQACVELERAFAPKQEAGGAVHGSGSGNGDGNGNVIGSGTGKGNGTVNGSGNGKGNGSGRGSGKGNGGGNDSGNDEDDDNNNGDRDSDSDSSNDNENNNYNNDNDNTDDGDSDSKSGDDSNNAKNDRVAEREAESAPRSNSKSKSKSKKSKSKLGSSSQSRSGTGLVPPPKKEKKKRGDLSGDKIREKEAPGPVEPCTETTRDREGGAKELPEGGAEMAEEIAERKKNKKERKKKKNRGSGKQRDGGG